MSTITASLYLSGPIKGIDDAYARFAAAEQSLWGYGIATVNPFKCEPICNCPSGAPQTDSGQHYDCFMRGDLHEMVRCSGVALLDGWERSSGARLEQFVALQIGLHVRPVAEWLAEASEAHLDALVASYLRPSLPVSSSPAPQKENRA